METGFDVLKKRFGVVSSDVWHVEAFNFLASGNTINNGTYRKSPFLGDAGGLPYKVPPGHILAITMMSLTSTAPASDDPGELTLYIDEINGETTPATTFYDRTGPFLPFNPPLLIPENKFVGTYMRNRGVGAESFILHLCGYLWRLETGKPVTAGGR